MSRCSQLVDFPSFHGFAKRIVLTSTSNLTLYLSYLKYKSTYYQGSFSFTLSLSLFLSFFFSLSLSLYLSLYISLFLSLSLSLALSLSPLLSLTHPLTLQFMCGTAENIHEVVIEITIKFC